MLQVSTAVGQSSVHGLGLFAQEFIPKGKVIWTLNPFTTQIFSVNGFRQACLSLERQALLDFLQYSYLRQGKVYYLNDNTRFINHCEKNPNIAFNGDAQEIATRDIQIGEEILENYLVSYDENDFFRLAQSYEKLTHQELHNYLTRLVFSLSYVEKNYA